MGKNNLESLTLSCTTIKELPMIADNILKFGAGMSVWLFIGELGAGKTTLIKEICKQLGVSDAVSSPSFAIINQYLTQALPVYHFDFYRIKTKEEAIDLGVSEYFYSGNYCFIEWPEKVEDILPEELLVIHIDSADNENRIFNLTKYE